MFPRNNFVYIARFNRDILTYFITIIAVQDNRIKYMTVYQGRRRRTKSVVTSGRVGGAAPGWVRDVGRGHQLRGGRGGG